LATRDGLTGLMNYQKLQDTLDQEMARSKRYGQPFGLVIADIDYFKRINDTYGHPAGDFVLKQTARLFERSLRRSDMAARYGGEEFALVMPATALEGALVVTERLRQKLAETKFIYDGQSITVSISQGIAIFNPNKNQLSKMDLVKQADAAVYEAKRKGRNRCCVYG
jgi:diguanylate cyclase (GGDEF)-like protein